ncbi:MAG: serine/threonine-protein kinase [Lentisphaeria bacterium]|nr:serine/threonine protein kinase [Lentisphaerota bacterium]
MPGENLNKKPPPQRNSASVDNETVPMPQGGDGEGQAADALNSELAAIQVPGFKLLSVLGAGGMGTVYLARQNNLERLVAVKVINPKYAQNPRFIASLTQEALTLGALSHPNIVTCHDVLSDQNGVFVIMEYVPGRLTARDLMLRLGPLPEDMVVEILLQVVKALAYVQAKGYIHRDLKPDNLLIYRDSPQPPKNFAEIFSMPDNRVMVCDFGIAAGAQSLAQQSGKALFGSPAFMSPEQAFRPEKVDFRSDIYSLAATAYYLLSGAAPFDGHERDERLLLKAENDIPAPIRPERQKIDRRLLKLLAKMGTADMDERYSDYASLLEDLEYLSLYYADKQKKLPSKIMRRKRSFFLGLLAGLIILVTALVLQQFRYYLQLLKELNYVSKTISLIFWEGDRDNWRIFQRDAGSEQPSLFGPFEAEALALKETLEPGQSLRFDLRMQGQRSSSIAILDENDVKKAGFDFYALKSSHQLFVRMRLGEEIMPLGHAELNGELDWTQIEIAVNSQQIWFYVNGELRGFRHLEEQMRGWRLRLEPVRANFIQLKNMYVSEAHMKNGGPKHEH